VKIVADTNVLSHALLCDDEIQQHVVIETLENADMVAIGNQPAYWLLQQADDASACPPYIWRCGP
jgi:hypothetical protein